jgi:uncharacterized protein involved in exopolysaccharide biosynthesis/Mrp family chromosome partitioning ATPase
MPTAFTIPEAQAAAPHSSMNATEILSAIFKHKWKVIICTVLGLLAATAVFFFYPRRYQSEAKLLVRYVLDRNPVDPIDSTTANTSFGKSNENVINSEVEILQSWDLAVQVAEAIGFKKLCPQMGENANVNGAAYVVNAGLDVQARKGSDILFVSYTNDDPNLTAQVLNELVNRYFVKHLEVHRSAAAFDFVSRQTDQVRSRLNETDDALKTIKTKAGMTSVADNTKTLSDDVIKIEDQYLAAEAELAEQTARVKQIETALGATAPEGASSSASPKPSASPGSHLPATANAVQQYQSLLKRLEQVRQNDLDLLSRYTPESDVVKLNRLELTKLENQKREMEKKTPDVITQAGNSSADAGPIDIGAERARLAGTKAKAETLKTRLSERVKQLSDVGGQIADLERRKELEETNYKYFEGAVEKARIDEALDPSKMPNISAVQRPSPPMIVSGKRNKIALALAGGGLVLGIGFALLKEIFLNNTMKRPLELETQLRAPVLLTIPSTRVNGRLPSPGRKKLRDKDENGKDEHSSIAPWDVDHFIRPYSEAIRDRLGLYFKLNGMTHKPKLVGVTGFSPKSGISTLAAGLAAALSEMGDGKVLLVDVNVGSEDVHPFFKGKSAHSLTAALQSSAGMTSAADGLYLATVSPQNETPMPLALKKFFDLMPNLKTSDFDYIIFDMPALSQTSPTLGMAGFMDKTLVIVEAEKSNRDSVKRGYAELIAARANVSVVLNKTRSYLPNWLDTES